MWIYVGVKRNIVPVSDNESVEVTRSNLQEDPNWVFDRKFQIPERTKSQITILCGRQSSSEGTEDDDNGDICWYKCKTVLENCPSLHNM